MKFFIIGFAISFIGCAVESTATYPESGTVSNAYELTKNFKNLRSLAKALRTPRIRVKNGIAINPFEVRFK